MTTSQRSESIKFFFDGLVNANTKLVEFVHQYKKSAYFINATLFAIYIVEAECKPKLMVSYLYCDLDQGKTAHKKCMF